MKQLYTDPRSTVRQRLDVEKHECWFNHVDSGIGMASENKFIGNKKQGSKARREEKGGRKGRKEGGKEAGLERNRTGSGTLFKGRVGGLLLKRGLVKGRWKKKRGQ